MQEVKLSKADKRIQLSFVFLTWLKCCEFNKMTKSAAILSLVDFQVLAGVSRKTAAVRVLDYFRDTGTDPNEMISIWEILQK